MSLEILGVDHRFGSEHVLSDVSIHVRDGDCYGLVGHNGAGKTTLLRVLLGLLRPRRGDVLVDGFDAARHPREAHARIGALAEFPSFNDALSGRRNLLLFARLGGLDRRDADAAVARGLAWTGLARAARKPVQAYSQGMRRRLGIAMALAGTPRHLVLDEPANGLDPDGMAEVRELLRRLVREQGLTVLLSSHLLTEIEGLCNRVGVLREGRLLFEETTATLLAGHATRYRLRGEGDEAPLLAELGRRGFRPERSPDAAIEIDVGDHAPAALLADLVRAGQRLLGFAPRPTTLEEIYLATRREGDRASANAASPAASAPKANRTPTTAPSPLVRRGFLRVLCFEFSRAALRPLILAVLLLPALAGALNVVHRRQQAQAAAAATGTSVFSTTDVTAFEGVAFALSLGLPLLVVLLAGFASQAISADASRGTLRNILLAPVTRRDAVLGKAVATLGLGAVAYATLVLAAVSTAAICFDFGDLTELLPNGKRFPLLPADAVWPELHRALVLPLLPLAAYAGIGFLAGALLRSSTGALALSIGAVVILDLARPLARSARAESILPSTYLPSALGDRTSFISYYADVSQGLANATYSYAGSHHSVPLVWALATLLAAGLLFPPEARHVKIPLGTWCGAALLAALGACSSGGLRSAPPPLADMDEPPALHAEPDDEAARLALPKGSFSGLTVSEAAASLDELAEGGSSGVLVTGVVENSPADVAGLVEGDLVLEATPDGQATLALDHPSTWRKLELETPPGTTLRLAIDRAGAARTTELTVVPRVRPAGRQKTERFREDERVGIVLRTATEVEARAVGLGPGAGAVVVGSSRSSPWRSAGLRLGDLLVAVDERPVTHPNLVLDAIREAKDDATLRVTYVRDGARNIVEAPVSQRESEVSTVFLPPLLDYESDRGTTETSVLLGLVKVTETEAAWELRLLWFLKIGGGDADTLEEVAP